MNTTDSENSRVNLFWISGIAVFLLLGIYLRIAPLATRGFEYDEIWTVVNYAQTSPVTIFTDLRVPNNHPLHSFGVWVCLHLFGGSHVSIRLTAFVAGCALLLIIPWMLFRIGNRPLPMVFLVTVWLALSPPLIHYAQTARGYSLQVCLLVLHASCLWRIALRPAGAVAWWLYVALIASGFLAVLTLPTTVLYLIPVTALHVLTLKPRFKIATFCKQYRAILIAHGILLAMTLLWLSGNAGQLASGQIHSQTIASWHALGSFMYSRGEELFSFPLLLLISLALFAQETRLFPLLFLSLVLFIAITLPVVQAGPSRVYTYLIPFCLIAAAEGFRVIELWTKKSNPYVPVVAVLALSMLSCWHLHGNLSRWGEKDWTRIVPELEKSVPDDVYIVYPVFAGLQIRYYFFPQLALSLLRRTPQKEFHSLALPDEERISGGSLLDCGGVFLDLPLGLEKKQLNIAGVKTMLWGLKKANLWDKAWEKPVLPGVWLVSLGPEKIENIQAALAELDQPWIVLNLFLPGTAGELQSRNVFHSRVLAAKDPPTAPVYKLLQSQPSWVRLYRLGAFSAK